MATKTNMNKKSRSANTTSHNKTSKTTARSKPKTQATPKPEPVEEVLAVSGIYPGIEQARAAYDALTQAGFMESAIAASAMRSVEVPESQIERRAEAAAAGASEYAMSTARIAGSMLALGSVPLLAPMLIAGPLLGAMFGIAPAGRRDDRRAVEPERPVLLVVNCVGRKAAKRAKGLLDITGAQGVAMGELRDGADLQSREYRDDSGNLHHHTHTYMRDHVA